MIQDYPHDSSTTYNPNPPIEKAKVRLWVHPTVASGTGTNTYLDPIEVASYCTPPPILFGTTIEPHEDMILPDPPDFISRPESLVGLLALSRYREPGPVQQYLWTSIPPSSETIGIMA